MNSLIRQNLNDKDPASPGVAVPEETYAEGAFSLITWGAKVREWDESSVHSVRDHMLRTIHPDTDVRWIAKGTAGRAAKHLVRLANGTGNSWSEYGEWQASRNRRYAWQTEAIFEGHPGKGLTFRNPQLLIDNIALYIGGGGVGNKTRDFIVGYTKAVVKLS